MKSVDFLSEYFCSYMQTNAQTIDYTEEKRSFAPLAKPDKQSTASKQTKQQSTIEPISRLMFNEETKFSKTIAGVTKVFRSQAYPVAGMPACVEATFGTSFSSLSFAAMQLIYIPVVFKVTGLALSSDTLRVISLIE